MMCNKNTTGINEEKSKSYKIVYNDNGATKGKVPIDKEFYHINDQATVYTHNSLEKEKHVFHSWNSKKDGSGKSYNPGDILVITVEKNTLYA